MNRRAIFENKERNGVEWLFAQADNVQRDAHVDQPLLGKIHHFAVHVENSAAGRDKDNLKKSNFN